MDCRAVRDALGWDKPNAKGVYHSSLGVAHHWIEKAGEEVVYLIPDGITDVTKSERTGCYPDAFARVLAAKEQWDADRAAREKKSWDDAQKAKDDFDRQKALRPWPRSSSSKPRNGRPRQRSRPSVTPK